ncbi:MAG: helix-turn-helix transcriptional regulator [Gammaproteobacteria bacterium]|nr:helix-turn-helix transcriptional regulator [Gammaproteobacteria bacterium]
MNAIPLVRMRYAGFSLKRAGQRAWFCGGPVFGTAGEQMQVGLYRIAMFIQLVRWGAGPDWRPQQIRLQVASLDGLESDLIQGASLEFNCPEPAIEVPAQLLSHELIVVPPDSASVPGSPESIELDFRDSLRQILRTHIRGQRFHIYQIARSLDLPVRTLQRRLADQGLVYSELVVQTRIDLARELLKGSAQPIHKIAAEVGYIESTHFARAFRRITGNSPRDYRTDNTD